MRARLAPLLVALAGSLCVTPASAQGNGALPTGEAWLAARDALDAWPEAGLYDLKLPSIDRQDTLQLSGYRGKKVLLIQFASW
ncbi:MAG: hypothetical protein ACYTG2_12885 [Planctomycetota bacterium]